MNGNQDFEDLKKLLISWNVEVLYDLFKEEDISIDELKVIKLRHISYLLKNYKMGVKIRFEYNLEKWRKEIGKPFQVEELPSHIICYCKSAQENGYTKTKNKSAKMPFDNLELDLSEEPCKSDRSYQEPVTVSEESPVFTIAELQQNPKNSRQDEAVDELFFGESSKEETTLKWPPQNTPELNVTLAQILQLSGRPGSSLIEYYEQNKCLSNSHRAQLIHLIVDFFYDNNYHMSLKKSRDLESQILKMFPTEQIEHYRSKSRGKIYIKFCNMKQYKSEKKKRKLGMEMPNNRDSTSDYNMDTVSYDSWPNDAEDEVEVKPEILSEEELT